MLLDKRLFSRFVVVGIINTALGLGVIFAASAFVDAFLANLVGYLLIVPVSFLTHRNLSFRDQGKRWSAFWRYIPTIGVGYAANLATLTIALKFVHPLLAQTLAIGSHVAITYVLSHVFVFLNHESYKSNSY